MAESLFITTQDVKAFTAANGNLDVDKFVQFVKVAQDVHIERILGTKLFEKLQSDIENSTLTGDYATLVTRYIKPCLIHFTMVEFLPFSAYTISNGGVYKHSSENSETVVKNEVDFLIEKSRSLAENYKERLIDYICKDTSKFPEYHENVSGDIFPNTDNYNIGWVL